MSFRVWERLTSGRPLEDLGFGLRNGRLDLRGLVAPQPSRRGPVARFGNMDVHQMVGIIGVQGAALKSLEFTASRLEEILFVNCTIEDCVFDSCGCRNWGLWGTTVATTTFRHADLRNAALGAVIGATRNVYRQVDFTGADLRGTAYTAAEFLGCTFKNTRLDRVDFQSSTFTDTVFEGRLREVLFYRHGCEGEAFPPNAMLRVDLSRAQLRMVEFRGLDLETVVFPADEDHVVVDDYPRCLDHLIEAFGRHDDVGSQGMVAALTIDRKWLGPRQRRGVINKDDVLEIGGEEALRTVLEVTSRFTQR